MFIATEKDIMQTVKQFETYCTYVEQKNPGITKQNNVLSNKACFEINKLLKNPERFERPTQRMIMYPSVSLWFWAGIYSELFKIDANYETGIFYILPTKKLEEYRQLNPFTQYMLLFHTWLTHIEADILYSDSILMDVAGTDSALSELATLTPFQWLKYDTLPKTSHLKQLMKEHHVLIHHLKDFGILDYLPDMTVSYYGAPKKIAGAVSITDFGQCMLESLKYRRYGWTNQSLFDLYYGGDFELIEQELAAVEEGRALFLEPFLKIFPENAIDTDAIDDIINSDDDSEETSGNGDAASNPRRVYELKVMLDTEPYIYALIRCSGNNTFEQLHLAIQAAFDFDNDHLYKFCMDGYAQSINYISCPYMEKEPSADRVTIDEAAMVKNKKIMYVFDFRSEWHFLIKVMSVKTADVKLLKPQLIKFVGTAPEQYEHKWD